MSNYIGVDLGTTFSAVAYIDETGRPTIVNNDADSNITPSVVAQIKGAIRVGESARRQWASDETKAAARFKRHMGSSKTFEIDGKTFTPTELSAAVLSELKKGAEARIGDVSKAVVTIPANFSHDARDATMAAAKMAGLDVEYIINEPTAAALYYAYQSDGELAGNFAVFDLGGGTFDVSVIKVSGHDVEVIASNGLDKLGGADFDKTLWDLVAAKYKKESGEDLDIEDFPMNDSEDLKRSLSDRKRATAEIGREFVDVTRIEFEEAISSSLAQLEMMCEATIDEANLSVSDITSVFLAGGSTRIPAVIEIVKKVFKQDPVASVNVDEVVALGAALYAAYKSDGEHLSDIQKKSVQKLKLAEVTNDYFGTTTLGHSESKGDALVNSIILNKGEKLPCSATRTYYTTYEGQESINCDITQSKAPETNPKFVQTVHVEELKLPAGLPAQEEIEVTYSYDENGMMHAVFKHVNSGTELVVELSMVGKDQASTEIEKFLVD